MRRRRSSREVNFCAELCKIKHNFNYFSYVLLCYTPARLRTSARMRLKIWDKTSLPTACFIKKSNLPCSQRHSQLFCSSLFPRFSFSLLFLLRCLSFSVSLSLFPFLRHSHSLLTVANNVFTFGHLSSTHHVRCIRSLPYINVGYGTSRKYIRKG